jgi:hypothetical protein
MTKEGISHTFTREPSAQTSKAGFKGLQRKTNVGKELLKKAIYGCSKNVNKLV